MYSSFGAREAALYPILRTIPQSISPSCGTTADAVSGQARDGVSTVACVTPAPASGATSMRGTMPSVASLCKSNAVRRVRLAACGIANINYSVVQYPSGRVLGTGKVSVLYEEGMNGNSRRWTVAVSMELVSATGVVARQTKAETKIDCTGGCTASAPWTGVSLAVGQSYVHTFAIDSAGTATDTTFQTPVVTLTNSAATHQTPPFTFLDLGPARCDTDKAAAKTSGCAFSDVAASYTLHLKGTAGAVAAHIKTAQQTKPRHFGWFGHGSPLTRATASSVAKNNRAVACPKKKYPNPATCDEYPFAATYQGAAFYPKSNSSAPVSAKANSAEGGFRTGMYRAQRVIEKDPYYVYIVN
jgi:hypothetical protein